MATSSMLKSLFLPALAVALAGWWSYRAGATASLPPPPPAPAVVGVVDMEKLMMGLDEIKARNTELKAINDGRQKELDAYSEKAKKLKAELDLLKPETKEARQKTAEFVEAREQGKAKAQIFQQLSDLDEGDIVRSIYTKAIAAIDRVAAKDGYSLVLLDDRALTIPKDKSGREINTFILNKRILYAAESTDITNRIITEMNNEYSAPAPRPAAPGAPPAPPQGK